MRLPVCTVIAAVAATTGCNPPRAMSAEGSSGTSTTSNADTASSAAAPDVPSPTGPPSIIDLGASALTITEGDLITVTAVVHDPDGDDDIVGGSLTSADAVYGYGTFARDRNGRWTVETSWDALHLDPELAFVGTTDVTVVARFEDSTSASAEATLMLRLTCPGIAGADCRGGCTDLETDGNNCGACGHVCDTVTLRGEDPVGGCLQQACLPTWSPCLSVDDFTDCTQACASIGTDCELGGCASGSYRTYADLADCRAGGPGTPPLIDACVPPPEQPWVPGSAVRCCCSHPR